MSKNACEVKVIAGRRRQEETRKSAEVEFIIGSIQRFRLFFRRDIG
jgi:hypothetical protein